MIHDSSVVCQTTIFTWYLSGSQPEYLLKAEGGTTLQYRQYILCSFRQKIIMKHGNHDFLIAHGSMLIEMELSHLGRRIRVSLSQRV
jgi:hypothetical protein